MAEPDLVACLGSDRCEETLRAGGYETLRLKSPDDLPRLGGAGARDFPRLTVVEDKTGADDDTADVIRRLRAAAPITDVLLWAPGAGGEHVRDALRAGAHDVILSDRGPDLVRAVNKVIQAQQYLPKVHELTTHGVRASRFGGLISQSHEMWQLFELCSRVAPSNATALIVGETGTGKELLARALHRRSERSGRFVTANCSSMPPDLVESELFGHEKGAFTGADRSKKGLVRHAEGGTLFLDEVGDMPAAAQFSLLRVLQERKIRPVGGYDEIPVNVRVVAATNVPLDDAVRKGDFREDLFYRLDVVRLHVPPLRERPEDIIYLFNHFRTKMARKYRVARPRPTDAFLDALAEYKWPGNVRQLENFVERLVLSGKTHRLKPADFYELMPTEGETQPRRRRGPTRLDPATSEPAQAASSPRDGAPHRHPMREGPDVDISRTLEENLDPVVERLERRYFEEALRENRGRITETAEQAGVSRRTLLRKLKAHGIDKRDFKNQDAA